MKKICPDCETVFEDKVFCPKCGVMGLTETEYESYKKALEDTSKNAIEEAMNSGETKEETKPEPPLKATITDTSGILTDDNPETDIHKHHCAKDNNESVTNETHFCEDSHCKNEDCSECFCDDDFNDEMEDEPDLDVKKIAKVAVGAACVIGIVAVVIKLIKRKK